MDHEPDHGPDSPSSGEDTKVTTPPKKRRGVQKRVVSVPIGDVEGSKSKGDGYPPSDCWAWRKYGQKPIKGSPYPRGYYRCSSSKGCPARKQVERSRVSPTMLILTYASDHNHPMPTTKAHSSSATTTPLTSTPLTGPEFPAKKTETNPMFGSQVDLELSDDSGTLFSDFGWCNDVATTAILESPICVGNSRCVTYDVAPRLKDEDDHLFADLGELPDCSVIFRHRKAEVRRAKSEM